MKHLGTNTEGLDVYEFEDGDRELHTRPLSEESIVACCVRGTRAPNDPQYRTRFLTQDEVRLRALKEPEKV